MLKIPALDGELPGQFKAEPYAPVQSSNVKFNNVDNNISNSIIVL